MRSRAAAHAVRFVAVAALVLSVATGVVELESAGASSGTVLCKSSDYSCTTGGYAGKDSWGYWPYGSTDSAGRWHNCTTYAAFKLAANGAANPGSLGDASAWAANARSKGIRVDSTPAVGAIAQWNSGHVAYVEEVGSGYVITTDDNYGYNYTSRQRRTPSSGWPDNFIHIKDVAQVSVGDGSFVGYKGNIYRIAGGAPVYVSTWNVYGGAQPFVELNDSQFASLRQYPADGTFVGAGGYVYRFAGGAPIYVSSWANVGGARPVTEVDPAAIGNADRGSPWNHVHQYPADGTFVGAGGYVYRFAGGAPIYVSSWANVGGARPVTEVDPAAIGNADRGSPWNHVHQYPVDGTLVDAGGKVYRTAGGAPLYVSTWSAIGGSGPSTAIDPVAIGNADKASPWNHLHAYPTNGTFVRTIDGAVFRFAGGAAIRISDWNDVTDRGPATLIDVWAINNPDLGDGSRHVRWVPADGTVVLGGPSKRFWRFESGKRSEISTTPGAVGVSDSGLQGYPIVK